MTDAFRALVPTAWMVRPGCGICSRRQPDVPRPRAPQIAADLAVQELEHRGYAILGRQYRVRRGEDIIARDGPAPVFVEVKTRTGREFGDAAEAVTAVKRRRLMHLEREDMLRQRLVDCRCRFDVVSIHLEAGKARVEVFQNAFNAVST